MMWRDIKELTIKTILIIFVSSLLGFVLLVLSYGLPNASIQSNASRSSEQLANEGLYPLAITGFNGTMLDNYTDAIMINSASYENYEDSIISKALKISHAHADWTADPIADLYEYYNDENAIMGSESYERYWHGYIVLLRPLLVFCDYANIRFMYFAAHFILLFVFLILLKNKTNIRTALMFLTSYLCTYAFITPLSLQYSHVFFVAMISGILLLRYDEMFKEKKYIINYFFLIVGIITSYIDLLTYPLITLGINLLVHILINKNTKIKSILIYIVMWGIGYGGMWAMKWIISSIVLNENVFLDAYSQMMLRTDVEQKVSLLDVIDCNLIYLKHTTTLVVLIFFFVGNLIFTIKGNKNFVANKQRFISVIIVTILPLLWYMILREHSSSHSVFTFRSLIISLFGILILPECALKQENT